MARRRPQAVIDAEHQRDDLHAQLRAHAKLCGRCSAALRLERFAAACDTGWQLLKAERRADAALDVVKATATYQLPGQLALF